jgi:CRP/FNR family cyclic AMP-dependent transcriptional regulator
MKEETMSVFGTGSEKLNAVRQRLVEQVFAAAEAGAMHRKIPAKTVLAFDPSRVWLVEGGSVSVEYLGRRIMTLGPGDVVGPWLGSVSPLSLVTRESSVELVGFDQATIGNLIAADPEKLKVWCAFQAVSTSCFFAEFAELKAVNVPPVPEHRSFAPGDVILREGDVGREVFLLTEGSAVVSVRGTKVGEIHRDEIFGALAALTEGMRTATVTATSPTICMVFAKNDFRDFLRSNAVLMEKLFEDFARALADLNNSVVKATNTKWRNLF